MRSSRRKGFSLASILLLTAVVSILLAAMCTAWLDPRSVDLELVGGCAVAGLLVGLCVGVGIGANHPRPVRGTFLGLLIGMITGAAGAALLAVPGSFPTLAIGSLVIVLFGIVVRLSSGKLPKQ